MTPAFLSVAASAPEPIEVGEWLTNWDPSYAAGLRLVSSAAVLILGAAMLQ